MPEWTQVIVRTLVAVVFLFALTRLLGKRQISQLSFFAYITGITIGDLAATVSLDLESNWYLGMVSLAVWAIVSLGIEFLQLKSKKARDFIDSTSTILIKDGKVLEDNLKKEKLTNEELLQQLRAKSAFKLAEVEFAIMELMARSMFCLKKNICHSPLLILGLRLHPIPNPKRLFSTAKLWMSHSLLVDLTDYGLIRSSRKSAYLLIMFLLDK